MREEESQTAHPLDAAAADPTTAAAVAADWGPGYQLWQSLLALLAQRGPDGTTSIVRMASHLLILFVAVAIIGMSRIKLPDWEIVQNPTNSAGAETLAAQPGLPRRSISVVGALVRAAAPITQLHERPLLAPTVYKVQPGDTLYAIADKFHISAETVMWANGMEQNPDLLRLDQELLILPVSGVLHVVVQGDTVDSVAKKYKANPADIISLETNHLDPQNPVLTPGAKVIVPGGSKPQVQRPVITYAAQSATSKSTTDAKAKGRFVWPASGMVTQGFASLHRAVDIGAQYGSPVKASDAGVVVVAGWSNVGYGNYIVIDHGNGYQTLYGHLSKIYVRVGQGVGQGATIGLVGSTGNSTGPHLHFEIHQSGSQRNPFNYLP
jgi:murein DD-endopeptidase MepM/ murein hydrolase activator NlpD